MQAKNVVCLIVLALMPCFLLGQVRPKVQKLADTIGKRESLEYAYIGGSTISEGYKQFLKLSKMAKTSELVELLNHRSPVVQGYAIMGLVDRKYEGLIPVFKQVLASNNFLRTEFGCLMFTESVASVACEQVMNQTDAKKTKWTPKEIEQTLSEFGKITVYTDSVDRGLLDKALLFWFIPQEKDYDRLRYIANRDSSHYALLALAKFHKEADVDFIKSFGKQSFWAIGEFPHPKFWDFLVANSLEYENNFYLKAVSKYCSPEAAALLSSCLVSREKIKPEFPSQDLLKDLYQIVSEAKCPFNDSILLKMWQKHKMIDEDAFDYLQKRYPIYLSEIIRDKMMEKGAYQSLDSENSNYFPPEILKKMLTLIKKKSINDWHAVVSFNIKQSQEYQPFFLAGVLSKEERLDFKTDFLEGLQNATNIYDIRLNLDYLLETKDTSFYPAIAKALENNKAIWNWGGWAESILENIKKYKLPVKL